ncbi:MAG: hypothetical protein PWP37_1180 [Thermotogota bacterium]|nr:hypothetical protein [Thermotogota bacterium]MDK2864988.1 hypothetical protein [Thermotogota bacterium]HCZ06559.1 hypothetical protein [Thermotogota bacterium]
MKEKRKMSLTLLQARILAITILALSLLLIALGSYAIYLKLTLKEYELKIVELKTQKPPAPKNDLSAFASTPTTTPSTALESVELTKVSTPGTPGRIVAKEKTATSSISEGSEGTKTEEEEVAEVTEELIERFFEVNVPSFEFLVSNMRATLDASESFNVTLEPSPDVIYAALEASPDYLIDRVSTDLFILVKVGSPTSTAATSSTAESPSSTQTAEFYSIQLLAYYTFETALEKTFLLRSNGFPAFVLSYFSSSGRKWHAVELGVYAGLSDALKASSELPEDLIGKIIGHNIADRFVRRIRSP